MKSGLISKAYIRMTMKTKLYKDNDKNSWVK